MAGWCVCVSVADIGVAANILNLGIDSANP